MITAHHAYLLGFTPQLMGVFFNGLAVLEGARRTAEGLQAQKIESLLTGWVEKRAPEVVKNVQLVEVLLEKAGREKSAPPQSVQEYYAWTEHARKVAYEAAKEQFDAESEIGKRLDLFRVRLAHDLGEQIGDISHTYILASLVVLLLLDGPEHALLKAQAAALGRAQEAATARLKKVISYSAGYEDIQNEVGRVLTILHAAPSVVTDADYAQRAAELAGVVPALELNRIEKLFTAPPPTSSPG